MKKVIVLLHGLPGAGKSTLAREVTEKLPDLYYADVSAHPAFRAKPMASLYAELYQLNGRGKSLIIEGVLPNAEFRDSLVGNLMRRFQAKASFDSAMVIGVLVDLEILASRRARSLSEYQKIAAKLQRGSKNFEYCTFAAATNGPNSKSQDVDRLASIIDEFRRR